MCQNKTVKEKREFTRQFLKKHKTYTTLQWKRCMLGACRQILKLKEGGFTWWQKPQSTNDANTFAYIFAYK